jgi:hypothetical protein
MNWKKAESRRRRAERSERNLGIFHADSRGKMITLFQYRNPLRVGRRSPLLVALCLLLSAYSLLLSAYYFPPFGPRKNVT